MKTNQIDVEILRDLVLNKKKGVKGMLDVRIQGCHVDNSKNTLWINLTYLSQKGIWVDDTAVSFMDYIEYSRNKKIESLL